MASTAISTIGRHTKFGIDGIHFPQAGVATFKGWIRLAY